MMWFWRTPDPMPIVFFIGLYSIVTAAFGQPGFAQSSDRRFIVKGSAEPGLQEQIYQANIYRDNAERMRDDFARLGEKLFCSFLDRHHVTFQVCSGTAFFCTYKKLNVIKCVDGLVFRDYSSECVDRHLVYTCRHLVDANATSMNNASLPVQNIAYNPTYAAFRSTTARRNCQRGSVRTTGATDVEARKRRCNAIRIANERFYRMYGTTASRTTDVNYSTSQTKPSRLRSTQLMTFQNKNTSFMSGLISNRRNGSL